MKPGFISLDGVDGVGKTTHIELLADWLHAEGIETCTCRDPGSTPLGEALRSIVLDSSVPIHRRSEMLLYMAARAQLVEQVIRPALEAGKLVICDRFLLSNVVYQGHAGGLDPDRIWEVGRVATSGITPDLTIVLDMPAASAAARIQRRFDRIESQGIEFLERVRRGFLAEARHQPDRIIVVDADREIDVIQHEIREAVSRSPIRTIKA